MKINYKYSIDSFLKGEEMGFRFIYDTTVNTVFQTMRNFTIRKVDEEIILKNVYSKFFSELSTNKEYSNIPEILEFLCMDECCQYLTYPEADLESIDIGKLNKIIKKEEKEIALSEDELLQLQSAIFAQMTKSERNAYIMKKNNVSDDDIAKILHIPTEETTNIIAAAEEKVERNVSILKGKGMKTTTITATAFAVMFMSSSCNNVSVSTALGNAIADDLVGKGILQKSVGNYTNKVKPDAKIRKSAGKYVSKNSETLVNNFDSSRILSKMKGFIGTTTGKAAIGGAAAAIIVVAIVGSNISNKNNLEDTYTASVENNDGTNIQTESISEGYSNSKDWEKDDESSETVDYDELYGKILEEYQKAVDASASGKAYPGSYPDVNEYIFTTESDSETSETNTHDLGEYEVGDTITLRASGGSGNYSVISDLCYTYCDINEDGIPELLVGVDETDSSNSMFVSDEKSDKRILSIYTINDSNEVVQLISTSQTAQNGVNPPCFYILEDGTILETLSNISNNSSNYDLITELTIDNSTKKNTDSQLNTSNFTLKNKTTGIVYSWDKVSKARSQTMLVSSNDENTDITTSLKYYCYSNFNTLFTNTQNEITSDSYSKKLNGYLEKIVSFEWYGFLYPSDTGSDDNTDRSYASSYHASNVSDAHTSHYSIPETFDDVLNDYKKYLNWDFSFTKEELSEELNPDYKINDEFKILKLNSGITLSSFNSLWYTIWYYIQDGRVTLNYLYYDINLDGVDELLVSLYDSFSDEDMIGYHIVGIYWNDNGKIEQESFAYGDFGDKIYGNYPKITIDGYVDEESYHSYHKLTNGKYSYEGSDEDLGLKETIDTNSLPWIQITP